MPYLAPRVFFIKVGTVGKKIIYQQYSSILLLCKYFVTH